MTRSMASYITYVSSSTNANSDQMLAMSKPISNALRTVAPLATGITSQLPTQGGATQEVYAFSDALQATRPIYVQVNYQNNIPSPTMTFNVGTSVAGGTLQGVTTTTLGLLNNSSSTFAGGMTKYFYTATGDGSFLTMLFNVSANPASQANDSIGGAVIERTRDADGTANGNGYTVWTWTNTNDTSVPGTSSFSGVRTRIYDLTGNVAQPTTLSYDYNTAVPHQSSNGTATTGGTSLTGGDTSYVYPVFTAAGTLLQGASKALALGWASDLPRVAPITLTQYGTPGTWLPMGLASAAYVPYLTVSATNNTVAFKQSAYALTPIFRWE